MSDIIQSNTILEFVSSATVADLRASVDSYCEADPKNCKTITLHLRRGFKIDGQPARRCTPYEDGDVEVATSCMEPEDHHGKRYLCKGTIMKASGGPKPPITFDEATEKATQLTTIGIGTTIRFIQDTGAERGCIPEARPKDEDQLIILSVPDDLPFDEDGVPPACMIPTIDESTLFAKPTGTK